jgi:hypothetical protein
MDAVKIASLRASTWLLSRLAALFAANPWLVTFSWYAAFLGLGALSAIGAMNFLASPTPAKLATGVALLVFWFLLKH